MKNEHSVNDKVLEINARIKNCEELVERHRCLVKDYFDKNLAFVQEHKPAKRKSDILAYLETSAPLSLNINAGMISNEIRSCLDALACTLALANGRSQSDVYFPIFKSQEIFESHGAKRLRKFSERHQDLIRGLEPYKGGNDRLWRMHLADRIRKHRGLIAIYTPGDIEVGPVVMSNCVGMTIDGKHIEYVYSGIIQVQKPTLLMRGADIGLEFRFFPKLAFAENESLMGIDHFDVLYGGLEEVKKVIEVLSAEL